MTTQTIYARTPNEALFLGVNLLRHVGVARPSRNGPMLETPGLVVTEYSNPERRVLINPVRKANPFFHLYEAMWMLAGRNDLAPLQHMVKTFGAYSDDGNILHGAYGYRWRNHFGFDNLQGVIELLRRDPTSRRAFLPMWDGETDPHHMEGAGKDYPCNVGINFKLRDAVLNMTVFCRSNDIILGAYGANLVHFSFLQEYVAASLGVGLGIYRQVSDSFHAYTETKLWKELVGAAEDTEGGAVWPGGLSGGYQMGELNPAYSIDGRPGFLPGWRLFEGADEERFFNEDLRCIPDPADFLHVNRSAHFGSSFFRTVFVPMMMCWSLGKTGEGGAARNWANSVTAPDWRAGALQWLNERAAA